MSKPCGTADKLLARAEANGYEMGGTQRKRRSSTLLQIHAKDREKPRYGVGLLRAVRRDLYVLLRVVLIQNHRWILLRVGRVSVTIRRFVRPYARTLVHSYISAGQGPAIRTRQVLDRQGFLCV